MPKNFVGEPFSVSLIAGTEKVWMSEWGGPSRFSVENFLSHSAENFRRAILQCCNNFGYRKSLDKKGGGIKIFRRKFSVSQCRKNFVGQSFTVAISSGIEKIWMRGGGVSRISVEKFLSHSAEKIRRAILHCCNNFGYRKSLDKRGGIKIFRRKLFCLTVPKSSVGESFTVAIISGIEKFWIRGGGSIKIFRGKIFCLRVPKGSVGESFTVALISGIEKYFASEGYVTSF